MDLWEIKIEHSWSCLVKIELHLFNLRDRGLQWQYLQIWSFFNLQLSIYVGPVPSLLWARSPVLQNVLPNVCPSFLHNGQHRRQQESSVFISKCFCVFWGEQIAMWHWSVLLRLRVTALPHTHTNWVTSWKQTNIQNPCQNRTCEKWKGGREGDLLQIVLQLVQLLMLQYKCSAVDSQVCVCLCTKAVKGLLQILLPISQPVSHKHNI